MTPTATRDPREALVAWRDGTGYSYAAAAALLGVTHEAVRHWTTGAVRVPRRITAMLRRDGWLAKTPRPRHPPAHHAPPCAPKACPSCDMRRRWQDGRLSNARKTTWLPPHEARLRALAGTCARAEIAAALTEEFGIPRTEGAVRVRAHLLGLSLHYAALCPMQVAYYCGVSSRAAYKWIARGLLPARKPAGAGGNWNITTADFEAFLRAHYPWLQLDRMPRSQWRSLVEALWRRDPTYTVPEAARILGMAESVVRYACQNGTLAAERVTGGRFAGTWYVIRRSALARFQVRRPASLGKHNNPSGRRREVVA